MSTDKHIDRICIIITLAALLVTVLFMNGEKLGIERIVDEDAEKYSDLDQFTANDQNGEWDTEGATVITLNGDSATVSGNGAAGSAKKTRRDRLAPRSFFRSVPRYREAYMEAISLGMKR